MKQTSKRSNLNITLLKDSTPALNLFHITPVLVGFFIESCGSTSPLPFLQLPSCYQWKRNLWILNLLCMRYPVMTGIFCPKHPLPATFSFFSMRLRICQDEKDAIERGSIICSWPFRLRQVVGGYGKVLK